MRTNPRAASARIAPFDRPLIVSWMNVSTASSTPGEEASALGRPGGRGTVHGLDGERHVALDPRSVLVGDRRADGHVAAVAVERRDDGRIALADHAAPHLARARQLLVVGVELLVQEHEALHADALRQIPVRARYVLCDQLVDLRFLCEVRVGGEAERTA